MPWAASLPLVIVALAVSLIYKLVKRPSLPDVITVAVMVACLFIFGPLISKQERLQSVHLFLL